jgi:predicted dinucleotide-binding enzyme
MMTNAIIGFGSIGQALARTFSSRNIDVTVASRKPPEALQPLAGAIGPKVHAKSMPEALEADTIFLAVPFGEAREIAKARTDWHGKTVIDVTNSYGTPPEELGGLPSSAFNAALFDGASFVKGFNHLVASKLGSDPEVGPGRRVIFLSSDDADAIPAVESLARQLGFAPVVLGKLAEGGALVHAKGNSWGQLIFQDLFKAEL